MLATPLPPCDCLIICKVKPWRGSVWPSLFQTLLIPGRKISYSHILCMSCKEIGNCMEAEGKFLALVPTWGCHVYGASFSMKSGNNFTTVSKYPLYTLLKTWPVYSFHLIFRLNFFICSLSSNITYLSIVRFSGLIL